MQVLRFVATADTIFIQMLMFLEENSKPKCAGKKNPFVHIYALIVRIYVCIFASKCRDAYNEFTFVYKKIVVKETSCMKIRRTGIPNCKTTLFRI